MRNGMTKFPSKGALPQNYRFIQNSDEFSYSVVFPHIQISSFVPPPRNQMLHSSISV